MRLEHPHAVMVVLFGESHMAPQHLPRFLQEALPQERTMTLLQNLDPLYWEAVGEEATAVAIGENAACIFNASPLEKYESYRQCLERWNDVSNDAPDFTSPVYNLIFSLARTIGFSLHSPRNGTQPKFLADSLPEVISVRAESEFNLSERMSLLLEQKGCTYEPESNRFFVREFQIRRAAQESARFLHFACRGMIFTSGWGLDVENSLAEFGADLLCPEAREDGPAENSTGRNLYQNYINGKVTKAAIRRLFLNPLKDEATVAVMKASYVL
jgi:hypothetical protein